MLLHASAVYSAITFVAATCGRSGFTVAASTFRQSVTAFSLTASPSASPRTSLARSSTRGGTSAAPTSVRTAASRLTVPRSSENSGKCVFARAAGIAWLFACASPGSGGGTDATITRVQACHKVDDLRRAVDARREEDAEAVIGAEVDAAHEVRHSERFIVLRKQHVDARQLNRVAASR
jgi:hypothetical protein